MDDMQTPFRYRVLKEWKHNPEELSAALRKVIEEPDTPYSFRTVTRVLEKLLREYQQEANNFFEFIPFQEIIKAPVFSSTDVVTRNGRFHLFQAIPRETKEGESEDD